MDTLVFDGKAYITSKQAAELTGYARDYIGQLARKGEIPARQVGRSWYVERAAIESYTPALKSDSLAPLNERIEPTVSTSHDETLPHRTFNSEPTVSESIRHPEVTISSSRDTEVFPVKITITHQEQPDAALVRQAAPVAVTRAEQSRPVESKYESDDAPLLPVLNRPRHIEIQSITPAVAGVGKSLYGAHVSGAGHVLPLLSHPAAKLLGAVAGITGAFVLFTTFEPYLGNVSTYFSGSSTMNPTEQLGNTLNALPERIVGAHAGAIDSFIDVSGTIPALPARAGVESSYFAEALATYSFEAGVALSDSAALVRALWHNKVLLAEALARDVYSRAKALLSDIGN